MKKTVWILAAGTFLALAVGCSQMSRTQVTAPPVAVTESPQPSPSPSPTPDPLVGQEVATLEEFLSPVQEEAYLAGCKAKYFLQGLGDNVTLFGFQAQSTDGIFVDRVEEDYCLYENSYAQFTQLAQSIFTDHVLEDPQYNLDRKFIDYQGQLAVYSGPGGMALPMVEGYTRFVAEAYPDTYRLEYRDGEKVEFTLIAHYDANWDTQEPMEVYTQEYPIRLVNTSDGWRVDLFHSAEFG